MSLGSLGEEKIEQEFPGGLEQIPGVWHWFSWSIRFTTLSCTRRTQIFGRSQGKNHSKP